MADRPRGHVSDFQQNEIKLFCCLVGAECRSHKNAPWLEFLRLDVGKLAQGFLHCQISMGLEVDFSVDISLGVSLSLIYIFDVLPEFLLDFSIDFSLGVLFVIGPSI